MATLIERCRCGRFLCVVMSVLAMTVFVHRPALADGGGGDDGISVILDQARMIKLPERAATVVIGNPLIADVSIQPGGVGIVNARGYGSTNLVVLDRSGAVLMERLVTVKGPYANTVVVHRGVRRETYSCAPFCEPRVTLGDAPAFFGENLGQVGTWIGQVQGAAQLGATAEDPRDRAARDRDRDRRTFENRDRPSWPFF
jgi:hypothetical protein